MDKTSREIAAERATLVAEAEALVTKQRTEALTAEESARLVECVEGAEALDKKEDEVKIAERLAEQKARMATPTRPALHVPNVITSKKSDTVSTGEAFSLWLNSFGRNGDRTPQTAHRARTGGFELGCNSAAIPVNYDRMNFKNRTILSKAGSASGAEYVYDDYSGRVVEYMTYFSPLLGFLPTDTTSHGNLKTYYKVDDTSMESTYTSASSGTETNPTVPETNLATASLDIGVFEITSGYQKMGHQIDRDSYVSMTDKIAKANAHSHARKMERDILTASGNGTTGVQGLTSACTAISSSPVSAWEAAVLDDLIDAVAVQYRTGVLLVANDTTKNAVKRACVDDMGRSLFDRSLEQGFEFDTFRGYKFLTSQYVAANTVLCFQPDFAQVRMVGNQVFQSFVEKFWPNLAWAGLAEFGHGWLGPTTAATKVVKS